MVFFLVSNPWPAGVPHSLQKRAPTGSGASQLPQDGPVRAVPHCSQNLPLARAPHAGQDDFVVCSFMAGKLVESGVLVQQVARLASGDPQPSERGAH